MRQRLAVPREHVAAALAGVSAVWHSEYVHDADARIFVDLLRPGLEWALIRHGEGWAAFLTGKPPAGFGGRLLGLGDAERALTTLVQKSDPDDVRTSPGWAVLKRTAAPGGRRPSVTT